MLWWCDNKSDLIWFDDFFASSSYWVEFWSIKGIVHPKMKILSSCTHPQVVPNLYECVCSAEHKGRYSEECGKHSSSGAPLTSIVFFFSYYGSQWCPKTAWLQTFFKISSFVFSRTNKFIQAWNYLRVSKWWQNFHLWVNYPFNYTKLIIWLSRLGWITFMIASSMFLCLFKNLKASFTFIMLKIVSRVFFKNNKRKRKFL